MEETIIHVLNQMLFSSGWYPSNEEAEKLAKCLSDHWDIKMKGHGSVLFRWEPYTKTFECEPLGGM